MINAGQLFVLSLCCFSYSSHSNIVIAFIIFVYKYNKGILFFYVHRKKKIIPRQRYVLAHKALEKKIERYWLIIYKPLGLRQLNSFGKWQDNMCYVCYCLLLHRRFIKDTSNNQRLRVMSLSRVCPLSIEVKRFVDPFYLQIVKLFADIQYFPFTSPQSNLTIDIGN